MKKKQRKEFLITLETITTVIEILVGLAQIAMIVIELLPTQYTKLKCKEYHKRNCNDSQ